MTPNFPKFRISALHRRTLIGWVAAMAAGVLALAAVQRSLQQSELARESEALHQLVSVRAGQHDAHLTALSAIAVAGAGQRPDLFLEVAATVSRFYPRIDEVQLVPLDPAGGVVGTRPLLPRTAAMIRAAAAQSTGRAALLPHPQRDAHYLLVKRSPNSDQAVYALALGIDAARLAGSDAAFWSEGRAKAQLSLNGAALLPEEPGADWTPGFARRLDSATQPLLLETGRGAAAAGLPPPGQVAAVMLLVSLAYAAALALVQQRLRMRAAEREAEMRRMEAQLTHASRVNAMGEMASGMAHELTQPLTAILAQAQAGRHLQARGDLAALAPPLEEITAEAKRASAILQRLRNWSRPQRGPITACDLRAALSNVQALLAPEAQKRGAALQFSVPAQPVLVRADQVEMEQVLHNLIRNALEALEDLPGRAGGEIRVSATAGAGRAVVEVADNGPGISPDLRQRLFTPFTTTREHGTGLGLALCQRLVERAGGEIACAEDGPGARFRITLPLQPPHKEPAP